MIIRWFRNRLAGRLRRRCPTARPGRTGRRVRPDEAQKAETGEGGPLACGWFDSSHDLREGLVVQEHAGAEALAQALPVALWLELHLGSWRAAGRG